MDILLPLGILFLLTYILPLISALFFARKYQNKTLAGGVGMMIGLLLFYVCINYIGFLYKLVEDCGMGCVIFLMPVYVYLLAGLVLLTIGFKEAKTKATTAFERRMYKVLMFSPSLLVILFLIWVYSPLPFIILLVKLFYLKSSEGADF